MMKSFPEVKEKEEMRKIIGRYGLTGRQQVCSVFLVFQYKSLWQTEVEPQTNWSVHNFTADLSNSAT